MTEDIKLVTTALGALDDQRTNQMQVDYNAGILSQEQDLVHLLGRTPGVKYFRSTNNKPQATLDGITFTCYKHDCSLGVQATHKKLKKFLGYSWIKNETSFICWIWIDHQTTLYKLRKILEEHLEALKWEEQQKK